MGGTLKRRSLGSSLEWTHYFDSDQVWSTRTSGSLQGVMDNGGGYYDYNLIRGRISVTRRGTKWKATAKLGLSSYDYKKQLGDNDRTKLFRSSFSSAVLLERSFGENWAGFLEWQREEDFSNQRGYEYNANVVSIGGARSL